ncbi:MAG: primosomal protein N', partial [Candidatus Caldarchaeum sp.]
TPSLESFFATEQGWSNQLVLTRRATDVCLPQVSIVDLREVFKDKGRSLFSPELRQGIEEALASKEQVMLFVNRRAFASALLCRDCGYIPQCVLCSVSLSLHRKERVLRCHHCRYQKRAPDVCPKCGSHYLRPLGVGTQKVEEFVQREFPRARVARLDRDTSSKRGVLESVFERLHSGEIDILVGTQMIAKGLDFPNVSLVGVVTADTSLSIPDFRATERTFQLLTQMAGRAGRHRPGKVIIQTFQPEHPAVRHAVTQDYEAFYREEVLLRKEAQYPPVVRLVNIIATSASPRKGDALMEDVARALRTCKEAVVLGPAECPLEKLHGQYRRHVLVKLPLEVPPKLVKPPDEFFSDSRGQLVVDVDPVSLL